MDYAGPNAAQCTCVVSTHVFTTMPTLGRWYQRSFLVVESDTIESSARKFYNRMVSDMSSWPSGNVHTFGALIDHSLAIFIEQNSEMCVCACLLTELRCHFCVRPAVGSFVQGQHVMYSCVKSVNGHRASVGIEPRTYRTLSKKHTTGPNSRVAMLRSFGRNVLFSDEVVSARTRALHTLVSFCVGHRCRGKQCSSDFAGKSDSERERERPHRTTPHIGWAT